MSPAQVAVAVDLRIQDFGWLFGLSTSTVRKLLAQGLPHMRYPGRITIPREAGAAWLARYRSDRVTGLVNDVLLNMKAAK